MAITQPKIDLIPAAIQGTTKPVTAIALTTGQQQANDIVDYETATEIKYCEKVTAALKHVFDHK